eukprot:gene10537-11675_t
MFLRVIFLCIFALATLHGVYSQEGEAPQQQVTLTREKLEQLLQIMNPTCRTELENALASQGHISEDCRLEIQNAFMTLGIELDKADETSSGRPQQSQQQQQQRQQQQQASAGGVNPEEIDLEQSRNTTVPLIAIVGFVVLLFGGAGAYVVYRNSQIDPNVVSKKPKKLSKKKEEKQRMKNGLRAQG